MSGFVGAANVINGRVRGGRLEFGDQSLPGAEHLDEGVTALAYIRPLDVRIVQAQTNGASCHAQAERVNDLGWGSKLRLHLADGQGLVAEVSNEDDPDVVAGQRVSLDLRNVKIFEEGGL